ncbi:MAG: hypothetical protein WCL18_04560 [bacterium]
MTVSEDDTTSPQIIVALGTKYLKFCGHTIPVTIIVHQLPTGRLPICPLKVVEETNPVSPTNEIIPAIHEELPVLI